MKLKIFLIFASLLNFSFVYSAEINKDINKQLEEAINTKNSEVIQKLLWTMPLDSKLTKYKASPLLIAIAVTDNEFIKLILAKYLSQNNALINLTDINGCSALFYCAFKNNIEIMELLISLGVKADLLNKNGANILDYASGLETIQYITNKLKFNINQKKRSKNSKSAIDEIEDTPLISWIASYAPQKENLFEIDIVNTINCLIKAGADVNLQNKQGESAIEVAITSEGMVPEVRVALVKMLLENKAEIPKQASKSSFYGNILAQAASDGNKDLIEILLKNGADPKITSTRFSSIKELLFSKRHTPLRYAITSHNASNSDKATTVDCFIKNVKYSVSEIADNFAMTDLNSDLSKYILSNQNDFVLKNINNQTTNSINYRDYYLKRTPIMWGIVLNNELVVKALLDTNLVNLDLTDHNNESVYTLALKSGNIKIHLLLLKQWMKNIFLNKSHHFQDPVKLIFEYFDVGDVSNFFNAR